MTREIVAETASKARYSFWRDLVEAWGDSVRIQDIRVLSLSKNPGRPPLRAGWQHRRDQANAIIRVIGSHGRHFLSENSDRCIPVENPWFAQFQVDKRNELWYLDRYSRKPILVRLREWPGFSDGGTLRDLIKHLAGFIGGDSNVNLRYFGPAPEWVCGGDPWAYGADMQKVRAGVEAIICPTGTPLGVTETAA